jgi:Fusaric acid resistance protein-like
MNWRAPLAPLDRDRWMGVHLAVNIFVATSLLWFLLQKAAGLNPIWAISSMIASSDPQVGLAVKTFRGRFVNALLGCGVGLLFLMLGGAREWKLPFALSVAVLLTTYVVRVQTMWRQAPIHPRFQNDRHGDRTSPRGGGPARMPRRRRRQLVHVQGLAGPGSGEGEVGGEVSGPRFVVRCLSPIAYSLFPSETNLRLKWKWNEGLPMGLIGRIDGFPRDHWSSCFPTPSDSQPCLRPGTAKRMPQQRSPTGPPLSLRRQVRKSAMSRRCSRSLSRPIARLLF